MRLVYVFNWRSKSWVGRSEAKRTLAYFEYALSARMLFLPQIPSAEPATHRSGLPIRGPTGLPVRRVRRFLRRFGYHPADFPKISGQVRFPPPPLFVFVSLFTSTTNVFRGRGLQPASLHLASLYVVNFHPLKGGVWRGFLPISCQIWPTLVGWFSSRLLRRCFSPQRVSVNGNSHVFVHPLSVRLTGNCKRCCC